MTCPELHMEHYANEFWRQVTKSQGCWLWRGKIDKSRKSGVFFTGEQYMRAQHAAWVLVFGPVPHDHRITSKCGNKLCVRPDHLRAMSKREVALHAEKYARALAKRRVQGRRLNVQAVHEIRALAQRGVSQKVIAKKFKVSQQLISQIVNREIWFHV